MKRVHGFSVLKSLLEQTENMLPKGLLLDGGKIGDVVLTELFPVEYEYIQNAVTKRQCEFTCGRLIARRLLLRLGYSPFPILKSHRGCPIWPVGIAGSITHTNNYCLVALGKQTEITSVGIDLERADAVEPNLWPLLFTEKEMATLNDERDVRTQNHLASLFFVAKEAFYKCNYPDNRQWLDFKDIGIEFNNQTKKIIIFDKTGTVFTAYQGFSSVIANHVVSVVWSVPLRSSR